MAVAPYYLSSKKSESSGSVMDEFDESRTSSVFRVLVVDDNQDAADSLCMLLQLWGFETEVAYDGTNALAVAQLSHPNCIITDIRMPGLDGYQLARGIRRDSSLTGTMMIAVSATSNEGNATVAGFDNHLTKPAD